MQAAALPALTADRSIPARIAEIARHRPDALALASATHAWSFMRLLDEASRIARTLLRYDTEGETPVALMLRHDAPLIAALLGTLMAGRCFAVLDPNFPVARNRIIIDNLGATTLLADTANAAEAAAVAGPLRRMRVIESLPDGPATALPGLDAPPDAPLGIFHTTGTTGEPKGVLWRQSLTLRRAMTDRDDVPIEAGDRFSLLTALCFPAAISDTFNALLNGASLHLYDMRAHGPAWLAEWLRQQKINCLRSPVALFRHLSSSLPQGERLADLKSVGLSGDALNRRDVLAARLILPPDCQIIHRYSMSEAGMVARDVIGTDAEIPDEIVAPGFVAPGKRLRILDDSGQLATAGEFGEIAIDLDGCAAGYWRRGQLEPLPSVPDPQFPGRRLYRCGDIGRFRADDRLELAGRRDSRVKIRGYRVEIPAVEVALRELACVREAAVILVPDASGESTLAGFVVPADGASATDIRRALAAKLPDYMVPSRFVMLDRLPLAGNGKLDRKALRIEPPAAAPVVPAENEEASTAERVRLILADLLGRPDVGLEDDFFAFGGHSLLAARALARVHHAFGRRLTLSCFYRAPNATALAAVIENSADPAELPEHVVDAIRQRTLRALGWLP
jgi:surfactin family lipopeptide synthetase A